MREFDLLKHVYAARRALDRRVLLGPGDDMAMVRLDGRDLLAAVDQLIAGRHVNMDATPLELVGRKAVMRSLSDIAAMAARPVASLASVVLPPDFGSERAKVLFDAMHAAAESCDCPLIGGDIAFHARADHPLVCTITVLAEPGPRGPITRCGAQIGDAVFVTGSLGGAVAEDGLGRHLTFEPRIKEALQLADEIGDRLHAMIDISDGLGRDASHIAERSGVRIEIDAERIPTVGALHWRRAAGDGEDYELLFTAAGEIPAELGDRLTITRIGAVVARGDEMADLVIFRAGGETISGDELGWQHES